MINHHSVSRQSGFVASYLLVGVILLVCVGAGLYILHGRTTNDSTPQPQKTAPVVVTDTSHAPTQDTKKDSQKPSQNTGHKASDKEKTNKETNAHKNTKTHTSLPETGPTETAVINTLMLAILTGLVVAYVRSVGQRAYSLSR